MNFMDSYNAYVGLLIAILSMIFGEYWMLFAGFLVLNIFDWLTGWANSRKKRVVSSKKGLDGILKKMGYWVLIAVAYMISAIFIEVGNAIHVDLHITTFFGLFVLCSLIINEVRSILENLVELGVPIPYIMIRGLEVVDKTIDEVSHLGVDESDIPEELIESIDEDKGD